MLPGPALDLEAWNEAVCDGAWGQRLSGLGERARRRRSTSSTGRPSRTPSTAWPRLLAEVVAPAVAVGPPASDRASSRRRRPPRLPRRDRTPAPRRAPRSRRRGRRSARPSATRSARARAPGAALRRRRGTGAGDRPRRWPALGPRSRSPSVTWRRLRAGPASTTRSRRCGSAAARSRSTSTRRWHGGTPHPELERVCRRRLAWHGSTAGCRSSRADDRRSGSYRADMSASSTTASCSSGPRRRPGPGSSWPPPRGCDVRARR